MPGLAQQLPYPARMHSHFNGDPTRRQFFKLLCHRLTRRCDFLFPQHFARTVQHALTTRLVSRAHTDRDRSLRQLLAALRTLLTSAILLHGPVSFALRVRIHWELTASRSAAGLLIPSRFREHVGLEDRSLALKRRWSRLGFGRTWSGN